MVAPVHEEDDGSENRWTIVGRRESRGMAGEAVLPRPLCEKVIFTSLQCSSRVGRPLNKLATLIVPVIGLETLLGTDASTFQV